MFAAVMGVVSQVMGVGGGIVAILGGILLWRKFPNENKKLAAEATKTGAEAGKTGTEAAIAVGGLHLQMSQSAFDRMTAAEKSASVANERANAADEKLRQVVADADQIRRDRDNDHELIQDLRRDFQRLHALILGCPTGGNCPVVTELHRFPDLLSGHDPGGSAA
ncbi:hypothetical protein EV383_4366 [Pseudonocardia sediminis]|uniref:Uncharacterized protein n=1 Tax=Pseudonocardia sediminis TaxID=1397368 RepID=A0A4Q7UZ87_PSEST|nr:hypothetical protein [Pseudonocardia sediminis]RZT87442.1 hypothetical protein EV383_4366 [Pseudonocardia sediminis]